MGPDAAHRAEAAAAGIRHQTAVVRFVLVSFICEVLSNKRICEETKILQHVLISVFVRALRDVHAVCLWDDKGPAKIHQALKEDILDFIKQAQAVSLHGVILKLVTLILFRSCSDHTKYFTLFSTVLLLLLYSHKKHDVLLPFHPHDCKC